VVPESVLWETHAKVSVIFPQAAKLFESAVLYDTNEKTLVLIASCKRGNRLRSMMKVAG
jgi:hypothetical protein